jgi:hypothetical protein
MNFLSKHKDGLVLAIILLLAAVLRFWGYADWSLSNDELSAITRLEFNSFGELVANGVRPDFHPAGVQVFLYYWTAIFGNEVWAVRLPFVLCGIASVWYVYLIAKRWFNINVAQLAALTLACLSYPILYSQLARPYSPGLLFSLGLVWHWTRFLFDKDTRKINIGGIVFYMAACMYTHYFSFFFAAMVGATGLLFLRKENYRAYLSACAAAVLLFMPHLGITLEQFWLGPPESDYLRHYLYYAFNESVLFIIVFVALFIISILTNVNNIRRNKFRLICLAWFFIPFVFGYYYSIYRNPILQYSVLLFSFPFLVIYTHSFYCDQRTKFRYVLLTVFGAGILFSAVYEQHFFKQKPFSEFKDLAMKKLEWQEKLGKKIPTIYNVIAPSYIDYYFDKAGVSPRWTWVRGDDSAVLRKFQYIIDTCKSDNFIYGWSNTAAPYEFYEIIKSKYPQVIEDHVYFNSRITLFSKARGGYKRPLLFTSAVWDEKSRENWSFDWSLTDTIWDKSENGRDSMIAGLLYPVKGKTEFSPGFSQQVYKLTTDSVYYIHATARIDSKSFPDIELVMELREHLTDTIIRWRSVKRKDAIQPHTGIYIFHLTEKMPERRLPENKLKFYFWNHGKDDYIILDMKVYSYADMDYAPVQDVKELIRLKSGNNK